MTGYFRNGCCDTSADDVGSHTVCVVMTEDFLKFSKSRGNDLSTPMPNFGFEGLKPGDRWCLCAPRWQEALEAGFAPKVVLRASHFEALNYCSLDDLKRHAIDLAQRKGFKRGGVFPSPIVRCFCSLRASPLFNERAPSAIRLRAKTYSRRAETAARGSKTAR